MDVCVDRQRNTQVVRYFIEILYVLFSPLYVFCPLPYEYVTFTFEITLLKMFQTPEFQI